MQRLFLLWEIPAAAVGLLLIRFRPKSVARFNRAVTNRITRPFAGRVPWLVGVLVRIGGVTDYLRVSAAEDGVA